MKPRIAVVLSGYGVVTRGAESMLGEILPRLEDRFDFHVYSRSGKGPGGIAKPAVGRTVTERPYLATHFGRKVLDTLYLDPIHVEWGSHLLASLPSLISGHYQVIWHETGLWGGFLLGALRRLTGVKLVDYAHSSHPGWELPFARRRPDLFITADADLADQVRQQVPGLRVEVVPQGVDCERFRPGIEPMNLDVGRPAALFVGALSPEKRPDLAVEAVAMNGWSLVVAGDGPLASQIDRLATETLGVDRYRRLDVRADDMARLYNTADVVVLSSPLESGALAVLESMACGTPVVTADDGIRRELVDDAGVLVQEQTPAAYAAGLTRAVETDWGDRPRERALSFTIERQARSFGELLASLTSEDAS